MAQDRMPFDGRPNTGRLRGREHVVNSAAGPEVGLCTMRIPAALASAMRADLRRAHAQAHERVGFVVAAAGLAADGEQIIIATEYHPVPDDDYLVAETVGACINGHAIRRAMELSLATGLGVFHVHLHDHVGPPAFSGTDRREQPRLIPSFSAVTPGMPHGMLLLSANLAEAWVWLPHAKKPILPQRTVIVGYPMKAVDHLATRPHERDWFARQSFLGRQSAEQLGATRVGIIGYGGGGSHIGQQAIHLGLHRQRIFDGDHLTAANHNRLIGGRAADIKARTPKTAIAERTIRDVDPDADVRTFPGRWQDHADALRACDVIIGGVDTFAERHELEVFARRWCIPYIDIGMDVRQVEDQPPRMAGQVIVSMPEGPCMRCFGFLTEERLAAEAARYGDTGGRPQVVWPNGVLASTAMGAAVDLITRWTQQSGRVLYYSYDGNAGTVTPHVRLQYLAQTTCPHFHPCDYGAPVLVPV